MQDFDFYKTFYKMWLDTTGKLMEETMRNPLFSQGMGKVMEGSVEVKKTMDTFMETALRNMQLPTPKDYASLAKKVYELESRLQALESGNHKKQKVQR